MRSRSEAAVIAGAASSFQLSSFPARNAKVSPIPMTTASRMPISEISFLFVSALRFRSFGSCAPMNIQKKTISKASSSADTGTVLPSCPSYSPFLQKKRMKSKTVEPSPCLTNRPLVCNTFYHGIKLISLFIPTEPSCSSNTPLLPSVNSTKKL